MRYSKRRKLTNGLIILYWVLSINLFSYISIASVRSFVSFSGVDLGSANELAEYWMSPYQYLESTLFGLFFGGLYILINQRLARWLRLDTYGFGKSLLIHSGVYFVGFLLITGVIYGLISLIGYADDFDSLSFTINGQVMGLMFVILCIIVFQIFLLNFILQSAEIMGDYNLARFLTGRYREPVIEDRAFVFLDLRSSTHIAEILDNTLYSEMLRDCFRDLNHLLKKYEAEVYQYVGDEVVLTWPIAMALKDQRIFRICFAFRKVLQDRAGYYEGKYGFVPEFKAGCNSGLISAAEIGIYKRDIAFHGDVINTAARVQDMCNFLGQDLLTTAALAESLNGDESFEAIPLGECGLKGKAQKIPLYAIVERQQ